MSETNGHGGAGRVRFNSVSSAPLGEYYTTGYVAKVCGVSMGTVIRWCDKKLIAFHNIPGSAKPDRRFHREDLVAFLRAHGMRHALAAMNLEDRPVLELVLLAGLPDGVSRAVKAALPHCAVVDDLFDAGAFCMGHKPTVVVVAEALGTGVVKSMVPRLRAWGCRPVVLLADEYDDSVWPCETLHKATVETVVAAAKGE